MGFLANILANPDVDNPHTMEKLFTAAMPNDEAGQVMFESAAWKESEDNITYFHDVASDPTFTISFSLAHLSDRR